MKTSLLIIFLVYSLSVLAQNNQPATNPVPQEFPSLNATKSKPLIELLKESGTFTQSITYPSKHAVRFEQDSIIQLFDSIYQWQYLDNDWVLTNRFTNILYSDNKLLSSVSYQDWNGMEWENSMKFDYTYDENNNLTSETQQNWVGSNWVNSSRITYTFDENNNNTSYVYQTWNSSQWQNEHQNIYDYDSNNNLIMNLFQDWNGGVWHNISLNTITWDSNDNIINYLGQDWNGNEWVNAYQLLYTYDENNNHTSEMQQNWGGSSWVNANLTTITIENNKVAGTLNQIWIDNSWENLFRNLFTYDGSDNQVGNLHQNWINAEWININQLIYTYDGNNNRTSQLVQSWSGDAWENSTQHNYFYDNENNMVSWHSQTWNGANWEIVEEAFQTFDAYKFILGQSYKYYSGAQIFSGDSSHFYFHLENVGIDIPAEPLINNKVYPNPGNGKFSITSDYSITRFEIHSIAGEKLFSRQPGPNCLATDVDISGAARGIYFLTIYNGSRKTCHKIVIL